MALTAAQQQAIAARGNVLVAAGAGTGKTRTLVERCLSCLLDETPPVSLEQILMVTFTEAAATEIRQRIRFRLEDELSRRPDDLRWHEQLALFDTARIGTLHSFCLQLIRPHFYELEIDPQVAVLAEDEARLLAEETLTKVLEGHYDGRTPGAAAVQQLIQEQAKGSDNSIRVLILRLHHYSQCLPDPAGWFEEQLTRFGTPQPVQWQEWLVAAFTDWRLYWLPVLDRDSDNPIGKQCVALLKGIPRGPTRSAMAAALEQLVATCGADPRGKKSPVPKKLEEFLAEAQFLLSLAEAGEKIDPLTQDWEWVRDHMTALLSLTREFGETFSEHKRQLGVLDFHDLEQFALRLLWDKETRQPTRIAVQWRQKLRFIFVDEYQDINAAQDKIIETLSGQGPDANRFLVGDVKQSIYRFRQADPHIFQSYATSSPDGLFQTITLKDNFRSREGILNFINSLFTLVMRKELGGVDYDEQAQLQFGAPGERSLLRSSAIPCPRVELQLRVKGPTGNGELEEQPDEALEEALDLEDAAKEARLVALRLRELKAQHHPIWDEASKGFRPVAWGDIAILLRAPSRKSEAYAKEFSRLKVPLLVQRSGFYESIEVLDLINLLQVLDNPLQDVPMLAVLHSPLAGLNVNELVAIRLAAKGPFWTALVLWHNSQKSEAMRQRSEVQSPEQKTENADKLGSTLQKVSTFLDRYARWRRLARQSSLSRCLESVLGETHYDAYLLTQPRGEQRQANLQRLLRLAQQFDNFQRQGLFRFLGFIEAQKRADTEPEVKTVTVEDSVRLMSIHQSKGLEFPVVVVADLSKPFNQADLRAGIILDEQYGLCPQIKPPHTGKRYPSLPYWLARRRQHRELLGEELRLLYVAMTRARDTLILSAGISQKKFEALGDDKSGLDDLNDARSFFDWIGLWFSSTPESDRSALLHSVIHNDTRLTEAGAETGDEPIEHPTSESPEVWARLQERLSWQYRFMPATRTRAKASVTALRQQASAHLDEDVFQEDGPMFTSPTSLSKEGWQRARGRNKRTSRPSAAEIGSAHHRFLQLVSLERTGSIEDLNDEARRLQREDALTAREIELLDLGALAAFWKSELGIKIRSHAPEVRRELQFTARFSIKSLAEFTGEPADTTLPDEFVVVQGVADLAMVKPEEIWLIDFKTDAIQNEMLSSRASLYEPQMKLYARALAQIYQRPVTGCWLYFLGCDAAVRIPVGPS